MNLILFDGDELKSESVVLTDHRAVHIRKILKAEIGAVLRVGKIDGCIGSAIVADSTEQEVTLRIVDLNLEPPAASQVELILALPRPKSLKRCLRAIANLGIKSIHLIHSSKVDKSYWTAPALNPLVMRQTLLDGLAIARDTGLPKVRLHNLFKPFAQDIAPHLIETEGYVAHPGKTAGLPDVTRTSTRVPIAIGPEGGFSDYEVKLLNEAGFKNLSLGERLYSVETAVPVIESLFRFR